MYADIRGVGGEVVAISFSKPERVAAVLRAKPLPFPAMCDPSLASYHAFGLGRTSWLDIVRPRVLLRFGRMLARGWLPRQPTKGEDLLQLGGDFVLGGRAGSRITYVYRSQEPTDRPSNAELLDAVRSAARS